VFVAYPAFLAGSSTGVFPLPVNGLVAVCTLVVVGYLVVRPEIGIPVFGIWSVALPVVLVVSGVGVLSLAGLFVFSATVVPLTVALVSLGGAF
jgi:hypothetical protein